ncbi:Asp-tRNA(Asn)/Glu-tRNA(Gln) amidotransferase subunit GatA [Marinomonas mediterranea]|jgi:aspartyl/glutamyl-tRNA(Asn/Gln) amidotransferase subunit A (EC 6.3.5.-)|uniref:Glutamyl-tRNA(Gln) amidotransferase subunit A n=1 Tax=Marinomonas mediterranea (strain ATCC 700492 / JCM 21426 / NBRC 103028 / MMB-1) TaxID=717774 RepID=F2K0N4_MARM1|nr:Asp-tRNA(Asn)/Glu-tRNA(Gln) amidotransferase subunit GatA [Marinomonas mediterranea]ADZ91018.1 Glutamyl-tRNA(Gln) amidotransferase subunit A [Marinomonas mediterranea MMB-1]WCN09055.1 Asp-tRNA(Asn)/Glu-tRNA(Gln) amidotransferase subunit GatA [Marinomonas mediterranea]WCN17157.1 Asp-tRNA(Asn)/Glu-tRNA(Gln) amidotransferase subunit GatA [Marinomonas mediterranea MMB-1]
MIDQNIRSLAQKLRKKELSSVELTQDYLKRINEIDPQFNSFITVTDELALAQAQAADNAIANGETSPLTGIPVAHKDLFCTEGVLTTCASKILHNFVPPYESTVTARIKAAGAVALGKTNMDEFAMGSSNENSYFGAVKNPWNINTVPGGSSGGSAAAVAAGLCVAATGTDTGGSIRQPASFCGITGLKPTYGRVSRFGMIAYASSLDQAGPMARSAEDCAYLLQSFAGFDTNDSTSSETATEGYLASIDSPLAGLKIGLPKEYFGDGLDSDVAQVIMDAVKEFEKLGATVQEISLPNLNLSIPSYYVIAPSEASSNLSRFDGVRYGHRCEDPKDLLDMYMRTRSEGFGKEVQKRIMVGTYALSEGYYDAYYVKAQRIRRLIKEDFVKAYQEVDVIMGPVAPTTAFGLGEKTTDPVAMYLEDIYTLSVNLAGIPAMSVPAGFSNGMPVGLQIMGNYFDEAKLLNVAHKFQQATDWHTQTPSLVKGA